MEGILAPWHWIILIAIVLLVFGPKKLPELGNSLGRGITGFKRGLQDAQDEISTSMAEADEPPQPPVEAPAIVQAAVADEGAGPLQT